MHGELPVTADTVRPHMIIYIMGGKLSFAFQVVVGERER